MSPEQERLKATLDDLHEQLSSIGHLDPQMRAQLNSALEEVQSALRGKQNAGAGKASKQNESLMRRLGEMAREFEDSHPALATTIGGLINTLANSGI